MPCARGVQALEKRFNYLHLHNTDGHRMYSAIMKIPTYTYLSLQCTGREKDRLGGRTVSRECLG